MIRVFFTLLVVFLASPSYATTWYVSNSGNDVGSGNSTMPFSTWQKAASVAVPGDTILLQAGRYAVTTPRSYGTRITRSGSSTAPITMLSVGGRAILDCSDVKYASGTY